jgi:glycosyltransferase involved in cell wall biosynthesis
MKTVAMISPNESAVSETFIKIQKDLLKANVKFYYGDYLPKYFDEKKLYKLHLFSAIWGLAKSVFFQKSDFGSVMLKQVLTSSFKKQKIEVCFAQYGITAVEMLPICKKLKIPLIVHFHGFDISAKNVLDNYTEKYIELFKYASYIIAVSKVMQQKIIDIGGQEISKKVIYNPCGPNDAFFDIKPDYSQKLFIGAGRKKKKKAPYATILAFKKVLEKHSDAKLILLGAGPLYDVCKELINYFGLQNSVSLPGAFAPNEFKALLQNALCFVQHSLTAGNGDMEGTPVAILEASAAGLPVISTFHAGIPDVIINGKTGLLVAERDIDGMAQNMLFILDNPEKAKEIGIAGRENIRQNFSISKHISKLNILVEDL